jgi:hypothetical protein
MKSYHFSIVGGLLAAMVMAAGPYFGMSPKQVNDIAIGVMIVGQFLMLIMLVTGFDNRKDGAQ